MKSNESISVAILLTCYNRVAITLDCLNSLSNLFLEKEVEVRIYLVDDGSTDGTSEAVNATFPSVQVIHGDGNLFWTGGMRLALKTASQYLHDFYLWINDDTILQPNALNILLTAAQTLAKENIQKAIIAGSTQDPETGELTYGGLVRKSWLFPCRFDWVEPGEKPKICETMNGNCVLLSRQVVETVGELDPTFTHYASDLDYGLRATRAGCPVYIAPGYVGTCSYNKHSSRVENVGFKGQLQSLKNPKGLATADATLHPFWEWKEFTRRHGGLLWPVYWLFPYRRVFGPYLKKLFKKTQT